MGAPLPARCAASTARSRCRATTSATRSASPSAPPTRTGSTTAYASLVGPIGGARAAARLDRPAGRRRRAVQGSTVQRRHRALAPEAAAFGYQWARCNARAPCVRSDQRRDRRHTRGRRRRPRSHAGRDRAGAIRRTSRAVFSAATARRRRAGARPRRRPEPSSPAAPIVAEVVQQGQQLIGSAGTWSGLGGDRLRYQWYRCDAAGAHCKSIRGATKTRYTQVAKDVGQTLGFAVRATDATGTTRPTRASSARSPRPTRRSSRRPSRRSAAPAHRARRCRSRPAAGAGAEPAFGYQWQRCNANGRLCAPIAGRDRGHATRRLPTTAATRSLALVPRNGRRGDAGRAQQRDAGRSPPRPPGGPANTATPTVGRDDPSGARSYRSHRHVAGSGAIAYTYKWYRCDAAGAHCLSIHGATKATYTQGAKDVGQTIGFAVHATDANGTTTRVTPLSSGPVAAAKAASPRRRSRRSAAGGARADARGLERQLEPDADHHGVSVATVQRERSALRADQRRHRRQLHGDRGRQRPHPARRGHRFTRRRAAERAQHPHRAGRLSRGCQICPRG